MKSNALRLTLFVLSSAAATGALAQTKTDGLWRGNGGAALSATSGNTSTTSVQLAASGEKATTSDKITLGAMINYGQSKANGTTTTTSNRWDGRGQYDYNLSPQMFVFGKLGLEADKLIDLDLRTSVDGGLGYKLISTPQTTFEIFGGAGYSTDKYGVDKTIGDKTDTSFSRASIYLGEASAHQLSPTVTFKQRLDLNPGVSGDKAVLAKFTAGLAVAMTSTLNLTVGLTDTYNSKPPVGTKSNDLVFFTGIAVKFGAV